MTEYTADPEAIAHYLAARARTANWVDSLTSKTLVAPFVPPSLVSDTDDGLSSQDSDAESSHSLPPRMVLKYPDGRPDVTVSGTGTGTVNSQWTSQGHKSAGTSPTYHSRSQPGSHGHHPSNPNIHSRAPSNAVPLYVNPHHPAIAAHPETIHVRPSPTGPGVQQNPTRTLLQTHIMRLPFKPRSRSMRSSRVPPPPLQMIYAPPPPPPLIPSSQSHSAPVSPSDESYHSVQQAPPLPPLGPHFVAPSPVYGFPSPNSPPEPPQAAPQQTSSRTHSRTHSYSSNHSYPHPPAPQLPNPGPPSSYHSGSAQRPRRHSSSRAGSSHPDPPQHPPPSIVYAPSASSSSYAYNPPVITSHPPPSMTIHAPTPHHAHARRIVHRWLLGRNNTHGRLFEDFSRTPSPNTARARATKESTKKDKLRKDKSRRKQRDGGGANNEDDRASFSSGSTYYVLPSPGQKIKVVPPSMNGLYAEPTSVSASKSTPALQSHRSKNGPYASAPPPPLPQLSRPQKRPLLQRIFHPHFGHSSNTGATYASTSSWRTFRR
ncbi:hypothetical protein BC826DRAFT_1028421 [Russula brevipes]|nr:hypothetical protein BC826DRAFT_1028421 [Russula brevipes]